METEINVRKKYALPSYYRFQKISFDIRLLLENLKNFDGHFQNVLESNKALCSNHHELALSVYDHYEQVSLTSLDFTSAVPSVEACAELGTSAGSVHSLSRHRKYSLKSSRRLDRPELDERNYKTPTPSFQGSYFQKCIQRFEAPCTRVRLIKLKPGKSVDWHIDYDPSYAVRVIVPLVTNPDVFNLTRRRGIVERAHLPADGGAWFLNTGFSHSVENNGLTERIVLMFSLDGQHDLKEIP